MRWTKTEEAAAGLLEDDAHAERAELQATLKRMASEHIEIPIVDAASLFIWSVWCSLSEKSFRHMGDRWNEPSRAEDPPYFGWLTSQLAGYPDTLHLQTTVQSRGVTSVRVTRAFRSGWSKQGKSWFASAGTSRV